MSNAFNLANLEVQYFACPARATILQKTAANVDAIRAAAQKLRSEAPHQTSARSP
jgi:hypothetical protein